MMRIVGTEVYIIVKGIKAELVVLVSTGSKGIAFDP